MHPGGGRRIATASVKARIAVRGLSVLAVAQLMISRLKASRMTAA